MQQIVEQGTASPETLHELETALDHNRTAFNDISNDTYDRSLLFPAQDFKDNQRDVDLFYEMVLVLVANARDRSDTHSFDMVVKLSALMWDIARNDAELSEYLEGLVASLTLTAPNAMLEYLDECSPDEFVNIVGHLLYLCDPPEDKNKLYEDMMRLNSKNQQYTHIITKIKEKLDAGCAQYWAR